MSALAENSSSGSARHCRWEMSGAFCSSVSLLALSSSPMRLRSRWCHSCWSMSSICWTCLPLCSFINIFSPTQFNESGTTFIWWIIDMKSNWKVWYELKGRVLTPDPKSLSDSILGGLIFHISKQEAFSLLYKALVTKLHQLSNFSWRPQNLF